MGVSIVVYLPDLELLRRTLATLGNAVRVVEQRLGLAPFAVWIVDNSPHSPELAKRIDAVAREVLPEGGRARLEMIRGQGNVGYGRANNLALAKSAARYHLVLNPDVEIDEDALAEALEFMEQNPAVGLLAPQARQSSGEPLYLCKAYPAVLDFLVRGFAPRWLVNVFRQRIERYELRHLVTAGQPVDVPLVSGCFMFFRKSVLDQVGGFAPQYFLYLEDFDLSLRAGKVAKVAYVPAVRIVHHGGNAARKGLRHVRFFCSSALRFYRAHGWKLV